MKHRLHTFTSTAAAIKCFSLWQGDMSFLHWMSWCSVSYLILIVSSWHGNVLVYPCYVMLHLCRVVVAYCFAFARFFRKKLNLRSRNWYQLVTGQLSDSADKAAGRISQALVQNRNANQCGGRYLCDTNMGKKKSYTDCLEGYTRPKCWNKPCKNTALTVASPEKPNLIWFKVLFWACVFLCVCLCVFTQMEHKAKFANQQSHTHK